MYNVANFFGYYSVPSPLTKPLTFTGKSATNAVCLSSVNNPNAITLSYSKNNGQWTNYSLYSIIELAKNDTVMFSGANDHFSLNAINRYIFQMTGTIQAAGNIQSLMNFSDSLTDYCYYSMFSDCTSLTKAPQLPVTILANHCYGAMFFKCSKLSSAPYLPATTLAQGCYGSMFSGCTSLTRVPEDYLPATTLVDSCYYQMFYGCTKLSTAPYLPATTLAPNCYYQIFRGCSKLSSINVAFTNWDNNTTYYWVYGVASNGTFTCPTALGTNSTITRGVSKCPTNWTVVNK